MQHYMRFLQFFYELNIFNSMSSFILNALTYSVFFITIKLNLKFYNNLTQTHDKHANNQFWHYKNQQWILGHVENIVSNEMDQENSIAKEEDMTENTGGDQFMVAKSNDGQFAVINIKTGEVLGMK